MKTGKTKVTALLLLIVLCLQITAIAEKDEHLWRDQADHNRWTNAMIFGNESYASSKPKEIRAAVKQLDDAILLCLDQFNGSYADKLQGLIDASIPHIPFSITAINFKGSSKTHRVFTHRGWKHTYTPQEISFGHADTRRELLYAVVDHIFGFSKSEMTAETAEKKCNAMCCLLYVTHIIGDRYHSLQYYGAASTLLLAEETESVIYDLTECLPTLLSESDCSTLIMKLKSLSGEIRRDERNLSKEELREVDSNYAAKLKNLLKDTLPDLLQNQSWFSKVFDAKWKSD